MMTVEERNNPEKFNEKKAIQALFFQKKEQSSTGLQHFMKTDFPHGSSGSSTDSGGGGGGGGGGGDRDSAESDSTAAARRKSSQSKFFVPKPSEDGTAALATEEGGDPKKGEAETTAATEQGRIRLLLRLIGIFLIIPQTTAVDIGHYVLESGDIKC